MSAQSTLAERLPFLRNSGTVGVGFVASGAAAYGFLAVTARVLGPARYAPLAAFWSVTFLVGPGCFSVLEKEVGRQITTGLALDRTDSPAARRVGQIGLVVCAVLVVGALILSPFLLHGLFDHSDLLLLALLISIPAIAVQFLAEGVLAGNGRFAAYSAIPAGEGGTRLLLAGILLACGVRSAGPLGLAIAVAPALSALYVLRALRRVCHGGPPVSRWAMGRSVAWMMGGTVGSSILVNSGPLVVKALANPHQEALAGRFLSGMVLVRVPLFLYNSAAATLLPALAGHAASENWTAFRANLNRLMAGLVAVGVLTTAAAALVGPAVLGFVFGRAYQLGAPDLAALAGSASALLLATTLSVALMAQRGERALCASWALGVAVMTLTVACVSGLLQRVELGLLLGSVAACGAMAVAVYWPAHMRPAQSECASII